MNFSTIVSGFPRTGTSIMMQMLHRGGLDVVADAKNMQSQGAFDAHGDYELNNIGPRLDKMTNEDLQGKAIKVVAPFIPRLPADINAKVIFMLRDPNEIITSLMAMNVVWEDDPITCVREARQILQDRAIQVLDIQFHDVIKYPRTVACQVRDFVFIDLDVDNMVKALDSKARTPNTGLVFFNNNLARVEQIKQN